MLRWGHFQEGAHVGILIKRGIKNLFELFFQRFDFNQTKLLLTKLFSQKNGQKQKKHDLITFLHATALIDPPLSRKKKNSKNHLIGKFASISAVTYSKISFVG